MENNWEKRVCRSCGYVNNDYKPVCQHYTAAKSGQAIINPDTESCDEHLTENELRAHSMIGAGVECAKYDCERESMEVLELALRFENDRGTGKRKSMITMIERRLRKIKGVGR